MNVKTFLSYIKNPKEISDNDIPMLEEFVIKNPYSQVGHLFLAKIAQDYDQPDKTLKLNRAALYTADRAVLKKIIEQGWDAIPQIVDQSIPAEQPLNKTEGEKMSEMPLDDQAKNEAQQDTNDQHIQNESSPMEAITSSEIEPSTEVEESTPTETQYPDVANQIIEAIKENRKLRDKLLHIDEAEKEAPDKKPKKSNNKVQTSEVIPDQEITKAQAEQLDNYESRKKKQFEIIDKFIDYESSLVKRKLQIPEGPTKPQEDLSIKSSSLNDDLISENLALIMKKQGKIEKAIDIYKKLIWKFPQKKAYFASLIEELKK